MQMEMNYFQKIANRAIKKSQNIEREESKADNTGLFYNKIIKGAGIPNKFIDKTFKNYDSKPVYNDKVFDLTKKIKYLKEFANSNKSDFVFLAGNVGNGKTHLAIATAKILAYQKAKELNELKPWDTNLTRNSRDSFPYMFFMDWRSDIKKIRNSYNSNESGLDIIRKMELTEILIIDDMFARSKISSSDLDDAFDLINYRYQRGKKTIITSNETPDDFLMQLQPKDLRDYQYRPLEPKKLDLVTERLASRILEACGGVILEFDVPNYRFKKVCI